MFNINKKVTIKDIANTAGVSTATVSKILNKKDKYISDKTRSKVLKIATDNNYVANKIAASMVTNKTYSIGLIISDITNEFFTKLSRGVEDFANKKGYNVILCNTDNNIEKAYDYLIMLQEKMVDGIIIASAYDIKNGLHRHNYINIPIVAIDKDIPSLKLKKSVGINNLDGGYKATKYLISKGLNKILHLTGDFNYEPTKDRVKGYIKALEENNINFYEDFIAYGKFTIEWGYNGIIDIIESGTVFDSVFCGNDLIAVGVIKALKEKNIKVPEDISVIGFDDIFLSSLITPTLTTVSQPMYKIGYEGARVLLNIIEDGINIKKSIELNTKIIVRNSTN